MYECHLLIESRGVLVCHPPFLIRTVIISQEAPGGFIKSASFPMIIKLVRFKILAISKILGSWGKCICHLRASGKMSSPFIPIEPRLCCSQQKNPAHFAVGTFASRPPHIPGAFRCRVTSLLAAVHSPFMTMNVAHWCFLHDSTEPSFFHLQRRKLPSEWGSPRVFPVSYSEVKPMAIRSILEPLYFHSGCHPNQCTR